MLSQPNGGCGGSGNPALSETYTDRELRFRLASFRKNPVVEHRGLGLHCRALLQRITFAVVNRDGTYGSWINTSSFREGEVFHAVPMK